MFAHGTDPNPGVCAQGQVANYNDLTPKPKTEQIGTDSPACAPFVRTNVGQMTYRSIAN